MRKAVIVSLLCLLPVLGCRGKPTDEGKVPVRRATPSASRQPESPDSAASLGKAVTALLNRFQQANSDYGSGEITKQERTEMAQDFEQDAWGLLQRAKNLADRAAGTETDPRQKAYKQELELFLLLYVQDLHAALSAERMALETGKPQWNKRARLHAQLLPSLANSIRWRTRGTISLPGLSPGPGRLPTPPAPAEKATSPSGKAAAPAKGGKASPAEKAVTGD